MMQIPNYYKFSRLIVFLVLPERRELSTSSNELSEFFSSSSTLYVLTAFLVFFDRVARGLSEISDLLESVDASLDRRFARVLALPFFLPLFSGLSVSHAFQCVLPSLMIHLGTISLSGEVLAL